MAGFFMVVFFLATLVSFIMLLVAAIRKKRKKKIIITMVSCFVFTIICATQLPKPKQDEKKEVNTASPKVKKE